jgi:2-methylcitrate dehydratase PrpD
MTRVSRRRLLQSTGGFAAVAALRGGTQADAAPSAQNPALREAGDVTGRLARYMVASRDRALPEAVALDARHRLLDTLGAMVSGARLRPGELAIRYIREQGGTPEATVLTAGLRTSASNAALANGMFAHADETDDFEPVTKAHPGCAVLPAALAIGEREDRDGREVLAAFALGYELCCRFLMALGPDSVRATHRSAEGVSSTFGAVGAAASLARLDETGMRYALSYAAQQVSGVWSWERDTEHVEKAFDFAGMGARNGVTAVAMVQAGFTGVRDALDGEHNVLQAFSAQPMPEEMTRDLGTNFYVSNTAIKVFSVGYPIQSPLDAFLTLRREHGLTVDNVTRIVASLPADGARIVDDRAMPDVNLQYALAVALIDGTLSFEASHSYERMRDARVLDVKGRIELVADRALMDPAAPRSGRVEVTLRDGRTVSHFTRHAPGTKENPLDTAAVTRKARELMAPVIGAGRADTVIERVLSVERMRSIRELTALLAR